MPGLAILCSGQGKQDAALFGRIQQYPEAQALMARILEAGVLPDEASAWLASPAAEPNLIFRNDLAQPLVCLYQMLIWEIKLIEQFSLVFKAGHIIIQRQELLLLLKKLKCPNSKNMENRL